MPRDKTIVLSAFAANPNMSSETGIGWSFIRATALNARKHDAKVVVVMNQRSVDPVNAQLKLEGLDGIVEAIGIDMPRSLRVLKDPRLTRFEYVVWWRLAMRVMKSLERNRNVVLAHHVTFATEVFPTPIAAFSKAVFKVWGPVGSAGDPEVYKVRPRARGIAKEAFTQTVRDAVAKLPAGYFGRRVDLVLTQNDAVSELFDKLGVRNRVFPNVILKPELEDAIKASRAQASGGPNGSRTGLRILSVGHLVPRKRFDLGLAVLLEPSMSEATYRILGKPLEGVADSLPELARTLGVADRVTFSGKVTRDQVLAAMFDADVLFHPSGREGASGVIGEATAVGIPVLCFANTGASSVLAASGASGEAITASADLPMSEIADAVLRVSTLPRTASSLWTQDRFQALCAELLAEAAAR